MRWHLTFTFPVFFLLWLFGWKYFLRYKKIFLFVLIGGTLWALPFDILATPIFHIYHFNLTRNLGISWLGIPFEEYIFIIFIPQIVAAITLLLRRAIYGKI